MTTTIPSLGTRTLEIYKALLKASENLPPKHRFIARIIGEKSFDFLFGKLIVLEKSKGVNTFHHATPQEYDQLFSAINNGTLQASYESIRGNTISKWSNNDQESIILHQATGKPLIKQ